MAAELVSGVNDETANSMKKMQIFVILPRPDSLMNPNTISLDVSSSDTVANLKARLEGIDGTELVSPIPPRRQSLLFAGSALPDDDDGTTLADLGVRDSSTVQLVETQMSVFVRDQCYPSTICHLFGLSSTDTVESLKARYEAEMGMPADRQRLRYISREMRNGSTLADCGVKNESTLFVDRLRWELTEAGRALARAVVVKVDRNDTVRRVKELVEAAEGVPVAAQRAYRNWGIVTGYTNEDLEDARTMGELGVMEWQPYEPVLSPPVVSIEYRGEAGAAEGWEERARVPQVLFRGSHEKYNRIMFGRLLARKKRGSEEKARKKKPYSRPPPPATSRFLHVFVNARDPLLPGFSWR